MLWVGSTATPTKTWSSGQYERFEASGRLLCASKGALAVNFETLPVHSCHDIVDGLESLRADLNVLRLRFIECKFSDAQYGRMLKAVQANKTLTVFEFGLTYPAYFTLAVIANMCDLVSATSGSALQTLSLPGLNAPTAAHLLEELLPVLARSTTPKLRSLQLHGVDLANAWPRLHPLMTSMLEKNRVLAKLEGCTIPWNDPAATRVRHLLKLNWYGRQFLPYRVDDRDVDDSSKVPTGLWGAILSKIARDKDHNVMRTFLQVKLVPLQHTNAYDPPTPPAPAPAPWASSRQHCTAVGVRKRGRPEE